MAKKSQRSIQHKGSRVRSAEAKASTSKRRILWGAGGLALILVAVLVVVALRGNTSSAPVESSGLSLARELGQPVDGRSMGDPNAPVLIEAYEDFQCPHCQEFTRLLEPTIKELVSEGTVRFVYRHRFVIGPESAVAGAAAECALDQGKFWEYHDALYARIPGNPRLVQPDQLKRLAEELGLDTGKFNRCLDTQKHYEAMLREDNEARNRGINATPTIFINGVQYQGEFTPEALRAAVTAAL